MRCEAEEVGWFEFARFGLAAKLGVFFERLGADVGGEELRVTSLEAAKSVGVM